MVRFGAIIIILLNIILKLYAEIKIHRSLQHPNIVRFGDCFEDPDNVYMTLELCQSGSLMDMLRHRRRFTPNQHWPLNDVQCLVKERVPRLKASGMRATVALLLVI